MMSSQLRIISARFTREGPAVCIGDAMGSSGPPINPRPAQDEGGSNVQRTDRSEDGCRASEFHFRHGADNSVGR